ncbi:hypothetical protein [Tepidibacillus marianensis]|uniref:hypothetical protein n=1 Tax=Tepidibacillus marianensis TaxID=3131995 RepID=UPI0030CE14ED
MSGEALWNRIIELLPISGQEIQTTTGLWFKASSIDGRLYINKAVDHMPSSELSMQRSISKKDFLLVYSYYDRWVNGEVGVRHEVSRKSRNTAYIFALIERFING